MGRDDNDKKKYQENIGLAIISRLTNFKTGTFLTYGIWNSKLCGLSWVVLKATSPTVRYILLPGPAGGGLDASDFLGQLLLCYASKNSAGKPEAILSI